MGALVVWTGRGNSGSRGICGRWRQGRPALAANWRAALPAFRNYENRGTAGRRVVSGGAPTASSFFRRVGRADAARLAGRADRDSARFGHSLLIAASGLFVLFLAGIGWRYIVGAVFAAVASAWPVWMYGLKDYQKQRILTMFSPESDKLGAGWNIIQSKTAIGSGGWEGKGWLQSTQSRLDFLPESHTDFIIAVLAEEQGLKGIILLLGLYLLILLRGFLIGLRAQTSFGRMMAGSLTLTFFVYIFVNMGMVAGLLPVVGVPLPLVSAGGTSVVTLLAGFGILMAISTEQQRVTK